VHKQRVPAEEPVPAARVRPHPAQLRAPSARPGERQGGGWRAAVTALRGDDGCGAAAMYASAPSGRPYGSMYAGATSPAARGAPRAAARAAADATDALEVALTARCRYTPAPLLSEHTHKHT
jgi:hypothetical protein